MIRNASIALNAFDSNSIKQTSTMNAINKYNKNITTDENGNVNSKVFLNGLIDSISSRLTKIDGKEFSTKGKDLLNNTISEFERIKDIDFNIVDIDDINRLKEYSDLLIKIYNDVRLLANASKNSNPELVTDNIFDYQSNLSDLSSLINILKTYNDEQTNALKDGYANVNIINDA